MQLSEMQLVRDFKETANLRQFQLRVERENLKGHVDLGGSSGHLLSERGNEKRQPLSTDFKHQSASNTWLAWM